MNPIQISQIGSEKFTPDNTDLIPIQQADGITRRITRANLLTGVAQASALTSPVQTARSVFLAHLDSDIVDIYGHSISSVGSPSLSTTQKKLGTKSLFLPSTTPSYLTCAASSDFLFYGDWLLECFCWLPSAYSSNGYMASLIYLEYSSSSWLTIGRNHSDASSNANTFYVQIGSGGFSYSANSYKTHSLGAWHHICGIKFSGNLMLFVDGECCASIPCGQIFLGGNPTLNIGASPLSVAGGSARYRALQNAYIQETRVRTFEYNVPTLAYTS
ncbi:hypothetical protein NSTC745_03874 [Nostoc sp. DSM 114161]|uniref:LamG-like jellyroll fold domain-containing protein n=1 Tax=Nostoc sp. DSM 114161 TaxID=3440143 RepID=UPI0040457C32